jgi:hypothetical protein
MANTVVNTVPFVIQGDNVSTSVNIVLAYAPTSTTFISAFNTNSGVSVSANILSVTATGAILTVNFVAAFSYSVTVLVSILPALSGVLNQTSATGAFVPAQCDDQGNLFMKEVRRSQIVPQASSIINSTTPVTILNALGAGIFADLTDLIVTPVPGATVSTAFTLTLSDGTVNYVFAMETGALTVVAAAAPDLDLDFDPELPATTANSPWTITCSSNVVSVYIIAIALKQNAS